MNWSKEITAKSKQNPREQKWRWTKNQRSTLQKFVHVSGKLLKFYLDAVDKRCTFWGSAKINTSFHLTSASENSEPWITAVGRTQRDLALWGRVLCSSVDFVVANFKEHM
jgi:hypothetical protein